MFVDTLAVRRVPVSFDLAVCVGTLVFVLCVVVVIIMAVLAGMPVLFLAFGVTVPRSDAAVAGFSFVQR